MKRTRETCTTCIYMSHQENEWPCDSCEVMSRILEKRKELKNNFVPRELSVFRKWYNKKTIIAINHHECFDTEYRTVSAEHELKECWNAAIDAVLKLPAGMNYLVERIKELKEP